ncbi:PssD/Cps14F family polysaccharide biosynthesis glycosyltransferase [Thalassotalea agariperforans]
MKDRVILLAFGKGGHQEQMQRLIGKLEGKLPTNIQCILITDSSKSLDTKIKQVSCYLYSEARDKHSLIKTFLTLPYLLVKQTIDIFRIQAKYNVVGIITTGPGVTILPTILLKLLGKKVIAFESWSRFERASLTGKLLNQFSNVFFIQNESLKKIYKNCIYKGKL